MSNKAEVISLSRARAIALRAQLLAEAELPAGKEGVAGVIETLGYVQIDTIAAIERAHHHTFWTRLADYRHAYTHDLQTADRSIFEYWGHALSYLPMGDFRFYLPRMRSYEKPTGNWTGYMHENFGSLLQPVLERIRNEGPLATKDFTGKADKAVHAWMPKPARGALMLLNLRGEILVSERRNFQCYYDLAERVIPSGTDTRLPSPAELARFIVRRTLDAYGIAQEKEMRQYLGGADAERIREVLTELTETDAVVTVGIEGAENGPWFVRRETLETAIANDDDAKVRLLSPFDNLIIQRDRVKRLFGFDYTLECYLPEAKRKHGYFVLPILWGDRLVGRLDPKAERKTKTLIVRSLGFEAGFDEFDELLPDLAVALADFARFNGCTQVELEKMKPARLRRTLAARVKKLN